MKIELWLIGKTTFSYLEEGMAIYEKRLTHYNISYQTIILPDLKNTKNLSPQQIKQKEGEALFVKLLPDDMLILFDEHGKHFTSVQFSEYLSHKMQLSHKRIVLLVGGAYGFSDDVYARANDKIALSKMTFSHQMIRLFCLEQLYRAMTILKNEPYHNE